MDAEIIMYSAALLLAFLPIAFAQDVINAIVVPTTARAGEIDTFGATIDPAASVTVDSSLCTMELMFGESSGGGNNVADIVYIDGTSLSTAYTFPKSLAAGPYHIRMNATSNTSASATPEHLTARSPTIQVTSASFTCATPPTYPNVTSPTGSSYTSFVLGAPQPGDVETVTTDGTNQGNTIVTWSFRDVNNAFGNGIDKFTLEFMLQDKKGNFDSVATVPNTDPTTGSLLFSFPQTKVVPGIYRIRANYTNAFQDGVVKPGSVVTSLSEEFFVAGDKATCEGVPGPGQSSSSGGGNSSGGGSSGGGTHSGSGFVTQPMILPSLFVSLFIIVSPIFLI